MTMTTHTRRLLPLFLCALCLCCDNRRAEDAAGQQAGPAPVQMPQVATRFAPELNVALDSMTLTDSGVYIDDVRAGNGATAEYGKTVVIEYRAWLPDGTLYEQRPNSEGFSASELVLGEGEPPGLHAGIAGMRTGGTRRIVVPPEHGYGLVARPAAVPVDATVVFEVRLRSVR